LKRGISFENSGPKLRGVSAQICVGVGYVVMAHEMRLCLVYLRFDDHIFRQLIEVPAVIPFGFHNTLIQGYEGNGG
jgi:hypothetical protein